MAVDRVATRLRVTVWATPGTVSSRPSDGRGGRECRNAGDDLVADTPLVESAALFGQRAVERRVTGVQPGDVVARGVGVGELIDDLVQIQRPGVDDVRIRRTQRQQIVGHDRARVQAHRTALQQPLPAHGDQIGGTGPGADEVDGHGLITASCLMKAHCVTGIAGRQPVNDPTGSPR